MAKSEQILRLKFIEQILRNRKEKGATYDEIKNYLQNKYEENDVEQELKFTERTFQRDKKDISKVSGIKISYSKARKTFYIAEDELTNAEETVFDNLLLVEAYRQTRKNSEIMIFEPRKSRGLNLLNCLIHAIQNNNVVTFTYEKFWTDEVSQRVVEPYVLKEFQHRWYLLANEFKSDNFYIKTYALDRITNLVIKNSTFQKQDFDVRKHFENSFGIIAPNHEQPIEIILSFDLEQGNYIKSLPLHHSQSFQKEENNRTFFRYFLVPSYDFIQQILFFGSRVEVISPEFVRNEVNDELKKALRFYKD